MMSFTFDLISDLHVQTWQDTFDWAGRSTSAHCLVVGDLARDRHEVIECLRHLGKCYHAVFYIDGNDEHSDYRENLGESYQELAEQVTAVHNVVYLQDNVVVIDGIAILGTNGWWGFDFDGVTDPDESAAWYADKEKLSPTAINNIRRMSTTDANYMMSSVRRLQTHIDVKKIVIATHTVPNPLLIAHDIDLTGSLRFNTMGNSFMNNVLDVDTEKKIHTWCFGHYHRDVDQIHNGIRYVNNCRGRGDTQYSNWVYHPKRITIDF